MPVVAIKEYDLFVHNRQLQCECSIRVCSVALQQFE